MKQHQTRGAETVDRLATSGELLPSAWLKDDGSVREEYRLSAEIHRRRARYLAAPLNDGKLAALATKRNDHG